jgi:hypothetical protein
MTAGWSGCVRNWGMRIRQTGLTGDEILPASGYCDGGKDWCRLLLGLVLFRLVVPPLQLGVIGPYLVQGTWFPSHLPLEGTKSYSNCLGRNRRPAVPGVQGTHTSLQVPPWS